jgi:hypothetical protein
MSFKRESRYPGAALTMLASLSWNCSVGVGIYCNLDADLICKTVTMPGGMTYHSFSRWPDPVHPLLQVRSVPVNGWGRVRDGRERKAIVTPWLFIYILAMQSQQQSVAAPKETVKMPPVPHLRITKTGTTLQSHNVSCLLHIQRLCLLNVLRYRNVEENVRPRPTPCITLVWVALGRKTAGNASYFWWPGRRN